MSIIRGIVIIAALALTQAGLSHASAGKTSPGDARKVVEKISQLRIPFVSNEGQVKDPAVKFYAGTFAGTLYVTTEGDMVYVLPAGITAEKRPGDERRRLPGSASAEGSKPARVLTLRERLIAADGGAQKVGPPKGLDPAGARINYLKGGDPLKWKSSLATYNTVSLGEIYEGIDVSLRAYGNNVEKIFSVSPGADYRDIRLRMDGAGSLKVNEQGQLEVETGLGVVRFSAPVAYQPAAYPRNGEARKYVQVAYQVSGDSYGFQVGAYNPTLPLIIDPVLAYSTYLGGNNDEYNFGGIAVDNSGNAYVTGQTWSANFPAVNALYGDQNSWDGFVAKISADGSALLFSTYLGGSSRDFGYAITVDKAGNAYVTGWTDSADFPTTASAFQTSLSGNTDAFVSKISADGSTLVYSTYLGGSNGDDYGVDIAVDQNGNVYVTGSTDSNNFPVASAIYGTASGGGDVFVSKLNADGSGLIYSTYLGGSYPDEGDGIAVDQSGNAYVTGITSSTNFQTVNALYGDQNSWDGFVAKFNADGSALLYSTYLGGSDTDFADGIAADHSGNAYVTGHTESSDFPTVNPLYGYQGLGDAFVAVINTTGTSLQYSTYLGGSDDDWGYGIAVDARGFIYVTGWTYSTDFPTLNPLYGSNQGGQDIFVTKINPSGSSLLYSTYLGGSGSDRAQASGIALDGDDNVYLCGLTSSNNFPAVNALYGSRQGGDYDSFVARISSLCTPPPSGLVAWWGGDNNALDMVGANNGTPMNGAAYMQGAVRQAFSFDGVDDYVAISDADFKSNVGRSMGFWINTTDAGAPTTFGHLKGAFFGRGNSVDQHLHLGIASGKQTIEWYEGGHHSIQGTSDIADGNWHYLVFVSDGSGTVSLYVDSMLENSGLFSHTSGSTSTRFGSQYEGNGSYAYFFNGRLDEIDFFNRALTAAEIAAIYTAGSAGKCRSCTASPSNMIAWWKAEGNAADATDAYNGTLVNGTTFATGRVGQAFSLDGVDDYMDAGTSDLFNFNNGTGNFTIDAWINIANFSAWDSTIITKSTMNPFSGWSFYVYPDGRLSFGGAGVWEFSSAAGAITTGNWTHVAVTKSGGTYKLFNNGIEVASASSGNLQTSSASLTIGTDFHGLNQFGDNVDLRFNGLIDEVEIYNRALSADEIARIYNAESAGKCSYAVSTNSPANGAISCSTPIVPGNNSVCTITPAAGYYLSALSDNTADVLASAVFGMPSSTYTISNVTADHGLVATFAEYFARRYTTAVTGLYPTVQAAYDNAVEGEKIQAMDTAPPGALTLDQEIGVTLQGGFNSDFSYTPGTMTVVGDFVIHAGTMTVENIIIQ